jgi:GTP-binding protein Era
MKVQKQMPVPTMEKRLDVVIIGSPNAGKSVLLNTLIGSRLAATSHKKHTTRSEILGVFNHRNVQLAFYDTPGFVRREDALKFDAKTLRSIVTTSSTRADVVLLVVDSVRDINKKAVQETFSEMVKVALENAKTEVILVLNKVDLVVPKTTLLDVTRGLVSLINGIKLGPEGAEQAQLDTTTFMISALKDDGVIDLKNYLISLAKSRAWVVDRDGGEISDLSKEERVEQILLEVLLENTHEEIPYLADIECKQFTDLSSTRIKIEVDIYIDSHRKQRIIIGQQGRTLVKLRQSAVEILEGIFKKQIILMIWVKLKTDKLKEEIDRKRDNSMYKNIESLNITEDIENDNINDDDIDIKTNNYYNEEK